MTYDLTSGGVTDKLVRFAVPVFLSGILQSLYGIVDVAVVGRIVGSSGLAAVSSASLLFFLIYSLGSGLATGGTILVAQYSGAKDDESRRRAAGTLFSVSAVASAVVMAIVFASYRKGLELMNLPAESVAHAEAYISIVALGTPFVFWYNAASAVLRGAGDSKGPLAFVAVTTVLNLALDLLLVGPLGMGTAGAAIATIFSQAVSFGLAMRYMTRKGSGLGLAWRYFKPDAAIAIKLIAVGLPFSAQMLALNGSYLLVTGMFNAHGVTVAAAAGVGLKVNTFAAMPCIALGQAITSMTGQCAGAGLRDRAAKTLRAGMLLALGVVACEVAVIQLFARAIVGFFDASPDVVAEGTRYLRVCSNVNFLAYAVMFSIDSFASGVGDSLFAMANGMLHAIVMRLALSVVLGTVLTYGAFGLYVAEAVSPIVPCVVGATWFFAGKWRKKSLLK